MLRPERATVSRACIETAEGLVAAIPGLLGRSRPREDAVLSWVLLPGSILWLAPRSAEHWAVATALPVSRREDVAPVLGAGEIAFGFVQPEPVWASNLSTGYCPPPDCLERLCLHLSKIRINTNRTILQRFHFGTCSCQPDSIQVLSAEEPFECKSCFLPLQKVRSDL